MLKHRLASDLEERKWLVKKLEPQYLEPGQLQDALCQVRGPDSPQLMGCREQTKARSGGLLFVVLLLRAAQRIGVLGVRMANVVVSC